MSRDAKKKLAIVAGLSECLVYAEAKYCAFEIHGEPKYYVCPRTEYCCNFGCCVSPGFQIYHLWYYWLLVIIMFLVCSGGGWWYRYWLQGRYRASASAIPSSRGSANSRGHSSLRGNACPAQQASITYNSARNTVLLHRMWKAGPAHRGAAVASPAYTGPSLAAAASSTHFQNTSVVLNDVNCPYYQLYGPPPSYETVIAQTRGKISSPMSPERSRNNDASEVSPSGSILQNQDLLPRCYDRSGFDRQAANGVEPIHRRIEPIEASTTFGRYTSSSSSSSSGGGVSDGASTPVHPSSRLNSHDYRGAIPAPLDDSEATVVPETFRIYRGVNDPQRLPGYHHGEPKSMDDRKIDVPADRRASRSHIGDSHSSAPDFSMDARFATTLANAEQQRYTRHHGGSLKFYRIRDDVREPPGNSPESFGHDGTYPRLVNSGAAGDCRTFDDNDRDDDDLVENPHRPGISAETRNSLLAGDTCQSSAHRRGPRQQTNPSENVILEPLICVRNYEPRAAEAANWRTRRRDNNEMRRGRVQSPGSRVASNANHFESKRNKLDRSKSLD